METDVAIGSMTCPLGSVTSHNLLGKFLKLLQFCSRLPATYAIKDEHDEIICGKFYQKELIKVV